MEGGISTQPVTPLKVYIETTIPSFYFETRKSLECVVRRRWTRLWWDDHRDQFDLATSIAVRAELSDANYPKEKREKALALLDELPLLEVTDEIAVVAETYVKQLLMPQQPIADAVHLAIASYYRCDLLLTWNCVHLANPNKFRHISSVNKKLGLPVPAVVTPLQLLGDEI